MDGAFVKLWNQNFQLSIFDARNEKENQSIFSPKNGGLGIYLDLGAKKDIIIRDVL